MQIKNLPMRIGVGIVVINSKKQVFVAKRKDNPVDKWQMPQGGVETGENLQSAMYRELLEETSISKIQILKELDYWLEYELPKNLVGIIWKGRYRGQRQKWFIVKYLGKDSEININTKNPEFIEWKWLDIKKLTSVIVDFKKKVYEKLVIELEDLTV
jgi:putative (di)nucleoside polyphosphate hydrolase